MQVYVILLDSNGNTGDIKTFLFCNSDNLIRVFTLEIQDPDHLQTAVSTKKEETEIVPSSADKFSSPGTMFRVGTMGDLFTLH